MKKTSIHEELRVLEEATYTDVDSKRLTIDAWLVNKVAELEKKIDYIFLNKHTELLTQIASNKDKIAELEHQVDTLQGIIAKLPLEKIAELQEQIDKLTKDQMSMLIVLNSLSEQIDEMREEQRINRQYHELQNRYRNVGKKQDQEKLEDRECRFGLKNCTNERCKHIETEE